MVDPKPENGAGGPLAALGAGELNPPKPKDVEGAAGFWFAAAGAAAAGVPELGVGVLPKPAKRDPAGLGEDAAGELKPPKFSDVGGAADFGTDAAAGAADAPEGGPAAVDPKPAKGAGDDFAVAGATAGELEAAKVSGAEEAAGFGAAAAVGVVLEETGPGEAGNPNWSGAAFEAAGVAVEGEAPADVAGVGGLESVGTSTLLATGAN